MLLILFTCLVPFSISEEVVASKEKEVVLDTSIIITSNVKGALVYLNGEKRGKVDEEIKLVKGKYIIGIAADGYVDVMAKKKITKMGTKFKIKFKKKGISKLLSVVTAGVGFGNVILGKTPDEVIKILGKPDKDVNGPHRWLQYKETIGIDIIFPGGIAKEIRFNKGNGNTKKSSTHITKDNIGIGIKLKRVIEVYGKPKSIVETDKDGNLFDNRVLYKYKRGAKIIYRENGILFWFDKQDKIIQFVVFTPRIDPKGK